MTDIGTVMKKPIQSSEGARFVYDMLEDRPSKISVNVNSHKSPWAKAVYQAIVWINGYPFVGVEWYTEEEAERDAGRVREAINAWDGASRPAR